MDEHSRTATSTVAAERVSLGQFLDHQRDTLAMKCAGLDPEQLRMKSVPPSALSLLGLVRHMTVVEQIWFRYVMNGEPAPDRREGMRDGEFTEFHVDDADPAEAFTAWREECARSRGIADGAESLDSLGHHGDLEFSLRYVLTHMIEEYARHNGHADLLRERIDGATGE
jgi:uncharacterized damage-inducible protein DinB